MLSQAHLSALVQLLEVVACPVCFAKVDLNASGETLSCRGCGREYPIKDGIPVLIAERASGGPTV